MPSGEQAQHHSFNGNQQVVEVFLLLDGAPVHRLPNAKDWHFWA